VCSSDLPLPCTRQQFLHCPGPCGKFSRARELGAHLHSARSGGPETLANDLSHRHRRTELSTVSRTPTVVFSLLAARRHDPGVDSTVVPAAASNRPSEPLNDRQVRGVLLEPLPEAAQPKPNVRKLWTRAVARFSRGPTPAGCLPRLPRREDGQRRRSGIGAQGG
jgi:hypothetical protein